MPLALVKIRLEPYHLDKCGAPDIAINYHHLTLDFDASHDGKLGGGIKGWVARLTLNRPAQSNLISPALAAELRDACQVIRESETVRVVVVSGAGNAFSVGRDSSPQEPDGEVGGKVGGKVGGSLLNDRSAWIKQLQVANSIAALPMPVIMSINGDALGHGLELALAGDLRICSENSRFGLNSGSQEHSPAGFPWDGGTQRLPRLVGPAWAADLILTSRTVDAAEALAIGLVNRVVPAGDLAAETQRMADSIAAGGPIAARYAKEAVIKGMDLSLDDGLRLEADLNVILQSTQDRAEGLRSFTEKRTPRYSGE